MLSELHALCARSQSAQNKRAAYCIFRSKLTAAYALVLPSTVAHRAPWSFDDLTSSGGQSAASTPTQHIVCCSLSYCMLQSGTLYVAVWHTLMGGLRRGMDFLHALLILCCYAEDVRSYKFTSFSSREELSPTESQLQAAENLVDALDLAQGTVLRTEAYRQACCGLLSNNLRCSCRLLHGRLLLKSSIICADHELWLEEQPLLCCVLLLLYCEAYSTFVIRSRQSWANSVAAVCLLTFRRFAKAPRCVQMVLSICSQRPLPTLPSTASSPSWRPELWTLMLACLPKTCKCSTPSAAPLATQTKHKLPWSSCRSSSLSSSR